MPERVVLPALLCAGLLLLAGCGGAPAATSAPVSPLPAETVPVTPSPLPTPVTTPTPTSTPTPEPVETAAAAETDLPAETPAEEDVWTALDAGISFGRPSGTGGALVVYDVYSDEDGLTVTLAPLPNEADVAAFQEAEEALPAGNIEYWSDAGGLVLQLENTVLSSGDVGGDDCSTTSSGSRGWSTPAAPPWGPSPGPAPTSRRRPSPPTAPTPPSPSCPAAA